MAAFEGGHFDRARTLYEAPETTGSPFLGPCEAGMSALADGDWEAAQEHLHRAGRVVESIEERALVSAAMKIKEACDRQVHVQHPEIASLNEIAYVMFREPIGEGAAAVRTCACLPPGRIDRSPCGTGSSAQMAVMHARGQIGVGERLTTRSTVNRPKGSETRRATPSSSSLPRLPTKRRVRA